MSKAILGAVAIGSLLLAPAYAAAQKSKGPSAPHGNPHTTSGPKTTTTGPKATTTAVSTHGNPHTSTAPTTTTKTHGNPHTTATSAAGTTAATTGTTTTGTTTAAPVTTTATATPLNPIAQKLQGKPLGARIEKMLPATMTLNTASAGFRNQGQFIAAVHVSQNLGIPFADLRAAMLGLPQPGTHPGTTTSSPLSLGQAIHKLRPAANSTTEATRAQTQANADLSITSTTATKKKR